MVAGIADVSDLGAPGGTLMILWVSSFRIAYSTTQLGVLFNGWPDGRAAEDQPQLLIEVFDIMRGEAMEIIRQAQEKR